MGRRVAEGRAAGQRMLARTSLRKMPFGPLSLPYPRTPLVTFIPPGAGQMAPGTPQPNSEASAHAVRGSVAFCRLRPPVHSVTPRVPFHGTRTRNGPIMLPQSNSAMT